MEKKATLLITILFFVQITFSQTSQSDLIKKFSEEHQFLKMDSLNSMAKNKEYYFYKGVFANVCNKPLVSNLYLDSLKNSPITKTFEYSKLKEDNYIKTFNYEMAYGTSKILITKFKDSFSKEDLDDEINSQRIWEVLRNQPKQVIEEFSEVSVPTIKDKAGLITISVNTKSIDTNFVFDTGAGISVITESMAKKYDVFLLPDNNIFIQSFTGEKNKVQIGIAPELNIGNLKIHNVVFLVYPDAALTFANGAYVINGIIGFPIAKELGTITIEKEKLTFSKTNENYSIEKNLFVDELRAIVMLSYKDKKLPFNFDSGASSSLFNKSFYEKFKSDIDSNGNSTKDKSSGAGGKEVINDVIELKNQEIFLGADKIKLDKIIINKDDYGIYGKVNFGNIGQDVIGQFEKVTISFDYNFLKLEN